METKNNEQNMHTMPKTPKMILAINIVIDIVLMLLINMCGWTEIQPHLFNFIYYLFGCIKSRTEPSAFKS